MSMACWRPSICTISAGTTAPPLVWNTSGYETLDTLRLLEGVINVYLPDLKHRSEAMGRLCAKAPDYFAVTSAAITEMVRQTGLPQYDTDGIMQQGHPHPPPDPPRADQRIHPAAGLGC